MNNAITFVPRTTDNKFMTIYINCNINIINILNKMFLNKNFTEEKIVLNIFELSKYKAAQVNIAKKFKITETGYNTKTQFINEI